MSKIPGWININPLVSIPFPSADFNDAFRIYYLYPPFGPSFFPFFFKLINNQKALKVSVGRCEVYAAGTKILDGLSEVLAAYTKSSKNF